ncbi:hypothetical protein Avbf_18081 [Armadillidium vulgare]|nr:hypothetical protein Avbf_18081 [Armadillidium vulgare]
MHRILIITRSTNNKLAIMITMDLRSALLVHTGIDAPFLSPLGFLCTFLIEWACGMRHKILGILKKLFGNQFETKLLRICN